MKDCIGFGDVSRIDLWKKCWVVSCIGGRRCGLDYVGRGGLYGRNLEID